jgi:hypothetical protein
LHQEPLKKWGLKKWGWAEKEGHLQHAAQCRRKGLITSPQARAMHPLFARPALDINNCGM